MGIQRLVPQVTCLLLLMTAPVLAEEPGQDNPLVSRFEGAIMHAHQESLYEEVRLPAGPVPRGDYGSAGRGAELAEDVVTLEGRVTWISYRAPEGRTTLEILRNYESALTGDGFEILFSCAQQGCGLGIGRYVRNIVYPDGYWSERGRHRVRPGYNVIGNSRALLAKRDNDQGLAHVFLYLDDGMTPPAIHQVVVEGEAMQTDQVQTGVRETGVRDAEQLQAALDTEGRVVVDGIFFEHDSAAVRPESSEALEQMARFLANQPEVEVLVVGHTDNQGSFDYNTGLSQRRAEAVRRALIDDHDIEPGRMVAVGVGFAAPLASNQSEAGRALNRRVELVLR